jgi:hypothetical protein
MTVACFDCRGAAAAGLGSRDARFRVRRTWIGLPAFCPSAALLPPRRGGFFGPLLLALAALVDLFI